MRGAVDHLDVTFLLPSYKVSYEYDTGGGVYRRAVNGEAHTDLNNGEAMLLQHGVAVHGTWQRKEAGEAFGFVADNGRTIALLSGQTNYLVVPNSPSFEGHVKL